jgi:hypothetical protein
MKSMTFGVFAYVLAFASTPSHALSFDFRVTELFGTTPGTAEIDGGGLLGLILASGGLVLLGWWRRRQKIG